MMARGRQIVSGSMVHKRQQKTGWPMVLGHDALDIVTRLEARDVKCLLFNEEVDSHESGRVPQGEGVVTPCRLFHSINHDHFSPDAEPEPFHSHRGYRLSGSCSPSGL